MHLSCTLRFLFVFLAAVAVLSPQEPQPNVGADRYLLGPGDEINIRVRDLEDYSNFTARIEPDGTFLLPHIGALKVSGMTIAQLQEVITARLRCCLMEPVVSVSIKDFRSQPVTVLGSVNRPGVHLLQGRRTLVEVLSLAEGLSPAAGNVIRITRRKEAGPLPLFGSRLDESGEFHVGEVRVKSLMEGRNPHENITICPHDFVTVPKAEMVYVLGSVFKPGAFVLNDSETLSVLHALSLAGGTMTTASTSKAKILRASAEDKTHAEVPINVGHMLSGKAEDLALHANDILYIPNSFGKAATLRSLEAAVQIGTGIAIWRR